MLEKILVCLDGSSAAERVLPYITNDVAKLHGKVVLLRVIDLPKTIIPVSIPGSPAIPLQTTGAVKRTIDEQLEAGDYLKKKTKALKAKGLDVEYLVLSGVAGETIVKYAQENDCTLIALATHGHGGFRRLTLGSTADYVVHRSSIPVLTVRR